MDIAPVILKGRRVRLEPMEAGHLAALAKAGAHEELWRWTNVRADFLEGMTAYVNEALAVAAAGTPSVSQACE